MHMVNSRDAGKTEAARQPAAMGLILELERLAFPARKLMYEAMARALKDKDVELTQILFTRFALHPGLGTNWEGLLAAVGKKKLSADKLAAEVQEQFLAAAQKASVRLDPALEALLEGAAKADFRLGMISGLPAEVAQELVERFKLKDSVTLHVIADSAKGYPTPDGWLKLVKAMGLDYHRCVALVTDAAACKSVLVAGMRCVVIPDAYTQHQDFGGADLVLEDLKEVRAQDLLALVHPCAFR